MKYLVFLIPLNIKKFEVLKEPKGSFFIEEGGD